MISFNEKYGIDAYSVLGVKTTDDIKKIKEKYHQKALVLHPDKTGGKTKIEFQILQQAYISIKMEKALEKQLENFGKTNIDSESKLKNYKKTEEIIPTESETDYEFFLENRLKGKVFIDTKTPVTGSYNPDLPSDTQYATINMKDFHKTFEYYQVKYQEEMQLTTVKKVKPVNIETDIEYSKIRTYNGILVNELDEERTEKDRKKYKKMFGTRGPNQEEYKMEKEKIENFSPKKISEKSVIAQDYKPVDVKYSESFSDGVFLVNQLESHKKYIQKNKEKIVKDPRIGKYLLQNAVEGRLETSSFKESDLENLSSFERKLIEMENKKI